MQRLSNNFRPKFTDEECMTVYLFGIAEGKFEFKAIYEFIKDYWSDWFPALPSYQNFNRRVNLLADAFRALCALLITERGMDENIHAHLLDSMPSTVASSKRSNWAKAAKGLCDKGFCPTKGTWYYGVKLHVLGQKQYGTLPKLCLAHIAPASLHDVTIAKQWLMDNVRNLDIFADMAYVDQVLTDLMATQNVTLFLCVRKKTGQQFLEAADELFSRAVSRTRQASESFFNWIQEKTRIQSASKVRSDNGLIAFIFARLASLAFFYS
jgi:hypothetical protein